MGYGAVLNLLAFVRVRSAELQRIRDELQIAGETSVRDVQVGRTEFVDVQWGDYFRLLHECSKSAALGATAKRVREAKQRHATIK